MNREQAVADLTNVMSKFTAYIGKRLPKDVKAKLADLRTMETNPLAKSIYDSMAGNQEAADKLDRLRPFQLCSPKALKLRSAVWTKLKK